ncbi:hypothetical protein HBB04_04327 [Pseudomonas coronafaciens]|nr:hypothetical protein HBB04_04327 [Pseudomonas coronafaciens]
MFGYPTPLMVKRFQRWRWNILAKQVVIVAPTLLKDSKKACLRSSSSSLPEENWTSWWITSGRWLRDKSFHLLVSMRLSLNKIPVPLRVSRFVSMCPVCLPPNHQHQGERLSPDLCSERSGSAMPACVLSAALGSFCASTTSFRSHAGVAIRFEICSSFVSPAIYPKATESDEKRLPAPLRQDSTCIGWPRLRARQKLAPVGCQTDYCFRVIQRSFQWRDP